MQPRINITKSACKILEEEVKRLFINKSYNALKNMPVREILTSKVVEHINNYYKLGDNDFIGFFNTDDKKRLRIDDEKIIYDTNHNEKKCFVWMINFLQDYDNFCRKLPFWTLSLSLKQDKDILYSIIINPFLDIFMFSEKGSGTVNNQRKVRAVSYSDEMIIAKSKNIVMPKQFEKCQKISLNSISIELIYLSMGLIDLYIISKEEYEMFLDCILIAKESGILVESHDEHIILANQDNIKNINL